MKNKLLIIVSIFILVINVNIVKADSDIASWIECNYEINTSEGHVAEGGKLILHKGKYYLISQSMFDDNKDYETKTLYDSSRDSNIMLTSDYFDGCWAKKASDIELNCKKDNEKKYNEEEAKAMLRSGKCPQVIRKSRTATHGLVFAGTSETVKAVSVSNQYKFIKKNDSTIIIEGFDNNGDYIHKENKQSYNSSTPFIYVVKYEENYTKLGEHETAYKGDIIFDSKNNINLLYEKIDEWYDSYGKKDNIGTLVENNKNLINACKKLNEAEDSKKTYSFSDGYTAINMMDEMKTFLSTFEEKFKDIDINGYPMCIKSENTPDAAKSAYNCTMKEITSDHMNYIPEGLSSYIYKDISNYLTTSKGIVTVDYKDSFAELTHCAVNLDKNANDYNLNTVQTSELRKSYEKMAKQLGIVVVYDCQSLIGENLAAKIEEYINIIKIAIPIILIGFGIVDFAKAMFASDESKMKEAQSKFIKRLIVAILIFLVPTFAKIILSIANQVWSNISPDGCGIF